jgi:cbb3-type cytochrome oxidase subunit 3
MIFTIAFFVVFVICGYIAFRDDNHDEWGHR